LNKGGYDGYLWLNNDTEVLPNLWNEIKEAENYSQSQFGQSGIYVGSTCNKERTKLTYGGFNFTNKWSLKDVFVVPNGSFQNCQCAHGNVTYISQNAVNKQGLLYEKYSHGGADHDYTYLAYKKGIPLIVLREYVGICENDHDPSHWEKFAKMSLKARLKFTNSPVGYNLKNTLLFQKRCFPYRYPFVLVLGYLKAIFPTYSIKLYRYLRS
jgi:GT2 family glycosyltransferase